MNDYFLNAAKPASRFETELSADCLSCGNVIRHPLCHHCISRGFREWALQFPDGLILCEKTKRFLVAHRLFDDGAGVRCISCMTKRTSICPRCFTEVLYSMVKEAGLGVRATTEFLFMFNFDFRHESYAVEFEVLGGY